MWMVLFFLAVLFIAWLLFVRETQEQVARLPYRRKEDFFRSSEWSFFDLLDKAIDHNRYAIFPKVRLGDILEVEQNAENSWGYWNRIKSRHVDFVIWDKQKSKIVLAIEIDGKSHNGHKAKENDLFKDNVFASAGIPLERIIVGTDYSSRIQEILKKL